MLSNEVHKAGRYDSVADGPYPLPIKSKSACYAGVARSIRAWVILGSKSFLFVCGKRNLVENGPINEGVSMRRRPDSGWSAPPLD
jgi:hypothetical protein